LNHRSIHKELSRAKTAGVDKLADIIICDDVEVPNTSNTAQKREKLRERLRELDFILAPNGTMIFIGTPHAVDTIYKT